MIKKFDTFNEGVRDFLKPKSSEEVYQKVFDDTFSFYQHVKDMYPDAKMVKGNKKKNKFPIIEFETKKCNYSIIRITEDDWNYKWIITMSDKASKKEPKKEYVFNVEEFEFYFCPGNIRESENGYLMSTIRYYESVRDMMKPKTFEQLKSHYRKYMYIILHDGFTYFPLELSSSEKLEGYEQPFTDIFERIGASTEFMSLIKELFELVRWWENAFFREEQEKVMVKIKNITEKLDELLTDDMKEKVVNLFSNTNESVRDHLKPKSRERFNDTLMKQMENGGRLGYFNPLEWGLTLEDSRHTADIYYIFELIFVSDDGRRWKLCIYDDSHKFPALTIREMKRGVSDYYASDYKEVEEYLMRKGLKKVINESVRDQMKPKSKEDIMKELGSMDPRQKIFNGIDMDIPWLVEEGIKEGGDVTHWIHIRSMHTFGEVTSYIEFACYMGNLEIIKMLLIGGAKRKNCNQRNCMSLIRTFHSKKTKEVEELFLYYPNQFTQLGEKSNESVRDMMKPKPMEEVEKHIPIEMKSLYDRIPFEKEYSFLGRDVRITVDTPELIVYIDWHMTRGYDMTVYDRAGHMLGGNSYKTIEKVLHLMGANKDSTNESVRDNMKPKSEGEIERAKDGMIQYIIDVVDINGGKITMGELETDSPPIYKSKTQEKHVIEELRIDSVLIVVYVGPKYSVDDIDEYSVGYDKLNPETLIDLKELLEDGMEDGLIFREVKESVRDFLKPKSKEDMKKAIDKMVPGAKLRKGMELGILSKEEARDMIDRLDPEFRLLYGKKYDLLSPREIHDLFVPLSLMEKIQFMYNTNYRYPSEKLMEEFKMLRKDERTNILSLGFHFSLFVGYKYSLSNLPYSDNEQLNWFETMLKRLRKITVSNVKRSKKYNRPIFNTNESVRDMMKPKSDEDIEKVFSGLTQVQLDLRLEDAVKRQQLSLVRVLLKLGANPNFKNPTGNTVVFISTVGGITWKPNLEITKMLLDAGADPTIPNVRGIRTLKYAEHWKRPDIAELLKQYIKE